MTRFIISHACRLEILHQLWGTIADLLSGVLIRGQFCVRSYRNAGAVCAECLVSERTVMKQFIGENC
jgi:hypothetical protein